ncbi:MAG: hypothetical protein KKA07_09350 [Bacteroidetes bacterium]|nr:hypothetical protein [Bacteroidota bacterium]MBU1719266.1 hypothetical protein [Bacteroidota bacterium]
MKKNWQFWTLATIITLLAAYYQRTTGPTYPKKVKAMLGNTEIKAKLRRSHAGMSNEKITLIAPGNGTLFYHRHPMNESFTAVEMTRSGDTLIAELPGQPMAGKLAYYIEIQHDGKTVRLPEKNPVVIRFRGDVPAGVMVPHILFMFLAMLFSNLTGLFALAKKRNIRKWTIITTFVLFVGGMILGPIVQKFAFNEFWAGVPFGWDLTDNKTLIAFIGWVVALLLNLRKVRPWPVVIAAFLTIVIFSIPHSMFGSELNYSTGTITQGIILLL